LKKTVNQFLELKYLPLVLSVLGAIFMLPSLWGGLVMDDLVQRNFQLSPSEIPTGLYATGMIPEETGKLSTVLFETFGFTRDKRRGQMTQDYGLMPWWTSGEVKASLWRPFTALTHWLDYRWFPDSPMLMHAHNIIWFSAVVFLASFMYRKIIGPTWVAGLAALMFVLDSNTYFPVMFVANRGFVTALCLGLLCFCMHHKWRARNSILAGILSIVFFFLSLLSNEAGVSTFAFVLAYALVLDKGPWSKRLVTLLPAIITIIIWRTVYQLLGYGISGIGPMYIDPSHEPLRFLYHLPSYGLAVIAGQLTSLPPDVMLFCNLQLCTIIYIFYIIFAAIALILFLPIVVKDVRGRFWFAVMIFAAIPIVSAPSSKNFGFVAIGAYGFIAVFVGNLIENSNRLCVSHLYRSFAWVLCIILLIVHIPRAAISRVVSAKVTPAVLKGLGNAAASETVSLLEESRVVIVNAPCQLSVFVMPFNAAYYGNPIPKSIRALAFACTALEIRKPDDKTVIIKSKEDSIFTSEQNSLLHLSHAFAASNRLFSSSQMFEKHDKFVLKGMTAKIMEKGQSGFPREVAFTFDVPLEDEELHWLKFNWHSFLYEPFSLPEPGETVMVNGPPLVSFNDAIRFLFTGGQ